MKTEQILKLKKLDLFLKENNIQIYLKNSSVYFTEDTQQDRQHERANTYQLDGLIGKHTKGLMTSYEEKIKYIVDLENSEFVNFKD